MSSNFDVAVVTVLEHEGGYVNDKVDPGGATNFGISLRFLKSLDQGDIDLDGDIDADDIRNLSLDDAKALYKKHWWDKYNYERIENQKVATKVLDLSVNMGAKQAHKLLQRAVNRSISDSVAYQWLLKEDGILGDKTIKAVNHEDPDELLVNLRKQAAIFYYGLIDKNPEFEKYEKGWIKRAFA